MKPRPSWNRMRPGTSTVALTRTLRSKSGGAPLGRVFPVKGSPFSIGSSKRTRSRSPGRQWCG